jgi:hypothetical protein
MNEPIKFEDLGTKFKYFDYRDLPARQLAPDALPEVYRPGKGWEPIDDRFDFLHSYMVVDEARIKEMIAYLEGHEPKAGFVPFAHRSGAIAKQRFGFVCQSLCDDVGLASFGRRLVIHFTISARETAGPGSSAVPCTSSRARCSRSNPGRSFPIRGRALK